MIKSSLGSDAAEVIALRALAAIIADDSLRDRFLALTGTTGGDMRQLAQEPAFLAAVLGFLAAHEPSLIRISAAIDCPPADLAEAARLLAGPEAGC